MSIVADNIRRISVECQNNPVSNGSQSLGQRLATALEWNHNRAKTEIVSPYGVSIEVVKSYVGNQPAAIFVTDQQPSLTNLLDSAALYAYHASIEWGMVSNADETVVFNSHWLKNNRWFYLPPIKWARLEEGIEIFEAMTPSGLTKGRIEQIAARYYEPDAQLLPVDDMLVDRLDWWRDETLRHVKNVRNTTDTRVVDEQLQALFAQMFVLRAVEDRDLDTSLPTLLSVVQSQDQVDTLKLKTLFHRAKEYIQSELFNEQAIDIIPSFVVAGIIKDLYYPSQLPMQTARYNFSWIDSDVLGRAYEKYLSTLIIPKTSVASQLLLWQQPVRDIERVAVRKAGGIFYTPSFLVRYLTKRSLNHHFEQQTDTPTDIPIVADISCGSGSFLTAAVDYLIRRFRETDKTRNWGRDLIEKKAIIGIDIDQRAVVLARLSLWLRLAEEPHPLPLPELNEIIVHGDSLGDEAWSKLPKECDVIVGNPPFIANPNLDGKNYLSLRFRTAQGRFDYSYVFVERALSKLKPNGVLSLVVQNRLFKNRDASIVRDILTSEADILSVTDFGSTEVFVGISAYVGTITAQKRGSQPLSDTTRYINVFKLPARFAGEEYSDPICQDKFSLCLRWSVCRLMSV